LKKNVGQHFLFHPKCCIKYYSLNIISGLVGGLVGKKEGYMVLDGLGSSLAYPPSRSHIGAPKSGNYRKSSLEEPARVCSSFSRDYLCNTSPFSLIIEAHLIRRPGVLVVP
jgi:hypothetical protein